MWFVRCRKMTKPSRFNPMHVQFRFRPNIKIFIMARWHKNGFFVFLMSLNDSTMCYWDIWSQGFWLKDVPPTDTDTIFFSIVSVTQFETIHIRIHNLIWTWKIQDTLLQDMKRQLVSIQPMRVQIAGLPFTVIISLSE